MLKRLDALEEGFRDVSKKSKEECGDKLEEMRQLIFIIRYFHSAIKEHRNHDEKGIRQKYLYSLVHACYLELARISAHILFLSCNGLYRNAFGNIRYALESIVQALYIDHRHPETPLGAKIEILKEVEDKREYHSARLIDELEIGHKDKLKKEYKKLSKIIHPSHKQVIATWSDILKDRGVPATIDREEISKIYDSMKMMYDIFFFLFITYFPEIKDSLRKNPDFIKIIKVYNLTLLSRVFKSRN